MRHAYSFFTRELGIESSPHGPTLSILERVASFRAPGPWLPKVEVK